MSTNAPAPRYATPRNPANPSFGKRVAAVAAALGTPLMPWQRQVADVVTELDPNNPGAWRYPQVVISVPRQAGKTALLRALLVDRMRNYRGHEIYMTAQTGKDARKRWNQIVEVTGAKKKKNLYRVYESRGAESLEYKKRRSVIVPFAPTPKSIHGESLHLVAVDEAWAFDAASGHDLETAILPTQITIRDSQLLVVSTKGTLSSAYLNGLIAKGRQAVMDPDSNMAYFEWSADPELAAADPYSDATLAFHPAAGHTTTLDKLRSLATPDVAAWNRSMLNLDPDSSESQGPIDLALWDSLACDELTPPPHPSRVSIGWDISLTAKSASVVAAWVDDDGTTQARLLHTAPGTDWIPAMLAKAAASGYAAIVSDDSGPARTMAADLTDQLTPTTLTPRQYASACQMLLDRARAGELAHDGQPIYVEQLRTAAMRPMGGAVALDPARSSGPIDVVRALACAIWHANANRGPALQLFIGGRS